MKKFLGTFHNFHISVVLLHKESIGKRQW